jgi:phage terminase small subunit
MAYLPPKHLDQVAKRKWSKLIPEIEARGFIYTVDLDALAAYCAAWSRWTKADPNNIDAMRALREMRLWARELRLTPKTRKIPIPGPKMKDDLDVYLLDQMMKLTPETPEKHTRKQGKKGKR